MCSRYSAWHRQRSLLAKLACCSSSPSALKARQHLECHHKRMELIQKTLSQQAVDHELGATAASLF